MNHNHWIFDCQVKWRQKCPNPPFNFIGTPLAENFYYTISPPYATYVFDQGKWLRAKARVADWALEGKIKACIKVSVFCCMSEEWSNDGSSTVLYDGTAQGCGEQKKQWFQERGRPHFLLKWRPDVIDFSRSVGNKNAKLVQSFQEEPYSPKETPILIFSRINHGISRFRLPSHYQR